MVAEGLFVQTHLQSSLKLLCTCTIEHGSNMFFYLQVSDAACVNNAAESTCSKNKVPAQNAILTSH